MEAYLTYGIVAIIGLTLLMVKNSLNLCGNTYGRGYRKGR